jgi:hypothetical protein
MKSYGYPIVSTFPNTPQLRDVVFNTSENSLYEFNGSYWVKLTTSSFARYRPSHSINLLLDTGGYGVTHTWGNNNPTPIITTPTEFQVGTTLAFSGIVAPAAAGYTIILEYTAGAPELMYTAAQLTTIFGSGGATVLSVAPDGSNNQTIQITVDNLDLVSTGGVVNSTLVAVTIPDQANTLGVVVGRAAPTGAFANQHWLTGFSSYRLDVCSNSMFASCLSLGTVPGSIYLPNVTSIGPAAFQGCSALVIGALNFPNCTWVRDEAFLGCQGLAGTVNAQHFPGVQTIGQDVFEGTYVDKIHLPNLHTIEGRLLSRQQSLVTQEVILPRLTTMTEFNFNPLPSDQGYGLGYLELTDLVTVPDRAFQMTFQTPGIKTLKLPSVQFWGVDVFLTISGMTIELTIRADQELNPNVQFLISNNTVTLVLV